MLLLWWVDAFVNDAKVFFARGKKNNKTTPICEMKMSSFPPGPEEGRHEVRQVCERRMQKVGSGGGGGGGSGGGT